MFFLTGNPTWPEPWLRGLSERYALLSNDSNGDSVTNGSSSSFNLSSLEWVLTPRNHTHTLPRRPTEKELEEATRRQMELLKVLNLINYFLFLYYYSF